MKTPSPHYFINLSPPPITNHNHSFPSPSTQHTFYFSRKCIALVVYRNIKTDRMIWKGTKRQVKFKVYLNWDYWAEKSRLAWFTVCYSDFNLMMKPLWTTFWGIALLISSSLIPAASSLISLPAIQVSYPWKIGKFIDETLTRKWHKMHLTLILSSTNLPNHWGRSELLLPPILSTYHLHTPLITITIPFFFHILTFYFFRNDIILEVHRNIEAGRIC